jgi:hypothetical protein
LHKGEFHNVYSSPDIRTIKSRKIGWGKGRSEMFSKCYSVNLKVGEYLGDLGADGGITGLVNCILKK